MADEDSTGAGPSVVAASDAGVEPAADVDVDVAAALVDDESLSLLQPAASSATATNAAT